MRNDIVRLIARNAIVAAMYFLLTFVSSPIAFLGVQVRVAELLVLLCFFNRDYTIGVTIGCLLSNLMSPLLPWDLIFGTLATLISCIAISFCRHLVFASIIPIVINGFVVAGELSFILQEPFWVNVGFVALGEFIAVGLLGYGFFQIVGRREFIQRTLHFNRNTKFTW